MVTLICSKKFFPKFNPFVTFLYSLVVDDSDHDRITASSLVTLSVTLYRSSLFEHCGISVDDLIAEASADHKEEESLTQPDPKDEVYM